MDDSSPWVSVARVIRPQGRRGEVLAEILTDFPERFATMHEAYLRCGPTAPATAINVQETWLHKDRVVLKLAQVDSISDAERLRGAEIVVPLPARVGLEKDAVYIDDLIGCELIDRHGPDPVSVGTVRDVIQQTSTTDLLVVVARDGMEHWIPFASEYVVQMDLANHRIDMNLPDGLLQINAPLNEEERQRQQERSEGFE